MPDMQRPSAVENRFQSHARGAESQAEVVVLLAPADEAFVGAIDAFEVASPDAAITPCEPWLRGVAEKGVPPRLAEASR